VASGEEVDLGVSSNDPESVVLPLKGVYRGPLVQVPDPDRLVLARRQDKILVRVEETAAGVLEVASASVDFPLDSASVSAIPAAKDIAWGGLQP
jgi:hypothetical protein